MASVFLAAPLLGQPGGPLPQPLPLLPPDNWWNVDVSAAPVDPNSADFIASIGAATPMHPDFGGDVDPGDPANPEIYGFPYASVTAAQALRPVAFVEFGSQSDPGVPGRPAGYPIPEEAKTQAGWIEGGYPGDQDPGGDRHLLLVDRDNRILYELYHTFWNAALDRWEAGSGAIFSLDGNNRRPEGWTSADAAGLAIFPGLVRYDEVFGPDPIRHAFRVTVFPTNGHVFPASHTASTSSNPDALPMGARLRLKASVDLSGHPAEVQKIFQAMKTYGLVVADNGTDMYVQGTHDTRWDNDVLNPAFASLEAGDFEVVALGWRPPVAGVSAALAFYTLTPCRLVDTRGPFGPAGAPALVPGWHRVLRVAGPCGVPPTARAVSANVTVTGAAGAGHVTFFPGDVYPGAAVGPPGVSTVNFAAGQTRANNAILSLATSGSGTVAVLNGSPSGAVHLIVDLNGYFQESAASSVGQDLARGAQHPALVR